MTFEFANQGKLNHDSAETSNFGDLFDTLESLLKCFLRTTGGRPSKSFLECGNLITDGKLATVILNSHNILIEIKD